MHGYKCPINCTRTRTAALARYDFPAALRLQARAETLVVTRQTVIAELSSLVIEELREQALAYGVPPPALAVVAATAQAASTAAAATSASEQPSPPEASAGTGAFPYNP